MVRFPKEQRMSKTSDDGWEMNKCFHCSGFYLPIPLNSLFIINEMVETSCFAGNSDSPAGHSLASRKDNHMYNEDLFPFRVTAETHQEEEVIDWLGPAP